MERKRGGKGEAEGERREAWRRKGMKGRKEDKKGSERERARKQRREREQEEEEEKRRKEIKEMIIRKEEGQQMKYLRNNNK